MSLGSPPRSYTIRGLRVFRMAAIVAGGLLFTVAIATGQEPTGTSVQGSALTSAMTGALREEGLVGAVWATMGSDGQVTLGAAGRRQADRPAPLTVEDRVQVGSVTKSLIAVGILRLATEGRLRLDAPVAPLLPRLRIENPWSATRPLLVRHLLDHTSGLDDARLWQLFNAEPRADTPLAAGFAPDRLRLVVRHPPGERFSYSNTGYGLLALMIEAVVGERYEPYLDAHLLHPLGMTHSTFAFVTQVGAGADPRLAMGHFEEGVLAPAVPTYLRPAMQFTTTAADMARFARFLLSDGAVSGAPFVRTDLLRGMGTPWGTEAARAGLSAGYGLGLGMRDRHGIVGRCHSGNTVGYRAMLCVYPEERRAFFIAMNADAEDANYVRLDSLVIATLGLTAHPLAPTRRTTLDARAWEGIYVASPARFEMFRYLDATLDFMRLSTRGGRVVLAPLQGSPLVLEPVGAALFRASARTRPSHVLLRTQGGAAAISDGLRTYERVSLWKVVPLWISLVAGIIGIVAVLVRGTVRAARGRLHVGDPLFATYLAVVALVIVGVLLSRQSVLVLGDATLVNTMLAVSTGALPVATLVGLWRVTRGNFPVRQAVTHAVTLLAVLQWSLVLAAWELLPLRLWR